MIQTNYNPDVLSCLANLSNDEVFTPPKLVNEMLDLLPAELWSNPNATFLDPVSKSGVFLREMAKRLMTGLEKQIPDKQERINHIFTKQLFGIAITELTSLLSRRSVYCSKMANGKYSVCDAFDDEQGNLRYTRMQHTWQNGKCVYCGASQEVYDRDDVLETYTYNFIHTDNPEEIYNNMKFDVIIGNPPYQMSDGGGTGDSAKPIYQHFVRQAKKIGPHFLIMITPSRWMKGGKGLDDYRKEMIEDTQIRIIYDFEDAKECFAGLHIDGGVSYFLWEKDYKGEVDYYYKSRDGISNFSQRYLKNDLTETVIRDFRQMSIIKKAFSKGENNFNKIVSSRNPYGFYADLFNDPDKYPEVDLQLNTFKDYIKIYGVKGKKGGAKRTIGYVNPKAISKENDSLKKYKLFFSKAYMTTSTVPPEIIIGEPNTISTETFLQIGTFDNKDTAMKCLEYIKTKFFRALLFYNRHSLNISRESFSLIPLQDFKEDWTDEKLYKKYGLTYDEIDFIESMIKPME